MTIATIKNVCAIGTGAMGAGTALCFAVGGYEVALCGRSETSLAAALKKIHENLASFVKQDLVDAADVPAIIGRVQPIVTHEVIGKDEKDNDIYRLRADWLKSAAHNADFVIESISEDLGIKHEVFSALNSICPSHTVFASNTSTLMPTIIASILDETRRDKFVNTHFFNPPHIMPLVEVVRGQQTSDETMDVACDLMHAIGKKTARLEKEIAGFIVNRIQAAMWLEAKLVFEEVQCHRTVDDAIVPTLGYQLKETGLSFIDMFTCDRSPIANRIMGKMQDQARHILQENIATREAIDDAIRLTLGLRLSITGPLLSADLTGLDIVKAILTYLDHPIPVTLKNAFDMGNLGAKTGRGIYDLSESQWAGIKQSREDSIFEHLTTQVFGQPVAPSVARQAYGQSFGAKQLGD